MTGRCISGSSPRGSSADRSGSPSSCRRATATRRSRGSCAASSSTPSARRRAARTSPSAGGSGTATFMILGDVCTRACGFCAVKSGKPAATSTGTSRDASLRPSRRWGCATRWSPRVDRDDLPDGGAGVFAATIRAIRARAPGMDDRGADPRTSRATTRRSRTVMAETPEIFNHNVETVGRLYRRVRPKADLTTGASSCSRRQARSEPRSRTKSGLMVGLGEEMAEVKELLRPDARRTTSRSSPSVSTCARRSSITRSSGTGIPTSSPS